ncbi:MAG: serine/threonine protein kinase [Sandaracinaceae bacterium]|nr:serine/threonine protein kinase [Sandaracinaceae bacterium]
MRASDDMPSVDPLIGAEIGGRYVVHELLARGGMGAVYQGVHLELGRAVAVKVLSSAYAREEEAVKRFQREARTAGRIDHPNIVAILDLGRLGSGEPYLVRELLEGVDLADCIAREAPMRPDRVVELLRPVANALDMVHAEGLLHRDIKPANIFLAARPDGSVTPKLLDFGLAALRDGTDADRLTREGSWSALRTTSRRRRRRASPSTSAPTCTRSGSWPSRCSRASCPSTASAPSR